MASYRLFPAAEADLEHIWHYTVRTWSVEQAVSYLDSLEQAFHLIAGSPYMCSERLEFRPPVRILHHESHLIVYLVRNNEVQVVRVLHEAMNIGAQLDE